MRKVPRIVGLALWHIVGAFALASPETDTQGRDLARYETAGPYLLPDRIEITEDGPLIRASIRDFLWRHWNEHRLGVVTVVSFTTEGLPSRTKYFIEPSGNGKWHVMRETLQILPGIDPQTKEHFQERSTSEISSFERIESGPGSNFKAIPKGKSREGTSYYLRFKDANGKVTMDEF